MVSVAASDMVVLMASEMASVIPFDMDSVIVWYKTIYGFSHAFCHGFHTILTMYHYYSNDL